MSSMKLCRSKVASASEIHIGAALLTEAGIVPPDSFTLEANDFVHITISGIGKLENPVAIV